MLPLVRISTDEGIKLRAPLLHHKRLRSTDTIMPSRTKMTNTSHQVLRLISGFLGVGGPSCGCIVFGGVIGRKAQATVTNGATGQARTMTEPRTARRNLGLVPCGGTLRCVASNMAGCRGLFLFCLTRPYVHKHSKVHVRSWLLVLRVLQWANACGAQILERRPAALRTQQAPSPPSEIEVYP
jgi:hypothetical protein